MEKNQFQEEIDKGESTLPPISTNLTLSQSQSTEQ